MDCEIPYGYSPCGIYSISSNHPQACSIGQFSCWTAEGTNLAGNRVQVSSVGLYNHTSTDYDTTLNINFLFCVQPFRSTV